MLAACPISLLLRKRILGSGLVFLLMFYRGFPRDHVHCGSASGPAFLFWLLVLISTLQLHKCYSGQQFQSSRPAPKLMLARFKLVKSVLLWDKMASETKYPLSKNKQKLFSKQVLIIL